MAKRYYPDWERVNPFRELDWRWHRAGHLVSNRRPYLPRRDDDATGRCVAYLRDRARGADLARRHPDLHAAHAVYAAGGDRRVLMEARILAGQTDAEIAPTAGLSPAAVAAFHESFFDVRDLVARRATDWITIRACGHTPGSLSVANNRVLLRLLGFFGGPHVLNHAAPFLTGGFDLASDAVPPGVDPALSRSAKLCLRLMLLPDTTASRSRYIRAAALLVAGRQPAEVVAWVLDPAGGADAADGDLTATAEDITRVPSGAAVELLHNLKGGADGLGTAEENGEGVLLRGPAGRAEGEKDLPRVRASRPDGRQASGGTACRAGAGDPDGAGTAGSDPAGRGAARPTVRGGDEPGGRGAVRGRVLAVGPPQLEELA